MPYRYHFPLDPECPDNPLNDFYDDPITQDCGCASEIAEHLEHKHRLTCKRCQEYGAACVDVVE